MRRAALGVAMLVAGCAELPRAELAWQAVHAVDVAQTVQIARAPCYRESDPVTSAAIGEHPSTAGALTWGVGVAALHAGVTLLLERGDAPAWVRAAWQAVTIGNSAYFVKNNAEQGIAPWGAPC